MRRTIAVVSLCAAVLLLGGLMVLGAAAADEVKPQTTCPVSGQPIDKTVYLDYQGQRIYFCCPHCIADFKKDPEKYFAKLADEGVTLENIQTTCPVSGEKLGEGDMGEPVTYHYKGRTIKLCCKMCVGKFEKDPAKYMRNLPGEQPSEEPPAKQ